MGRGKSKGLNSARRLQYNRRKNRWADPDYKGNSNPKSFKNELYGASFAKGIVMSKHAISASPPNNGRRSLLKVHLIKSKKKVLVHVPYDGILNYASENDTVLVCGTSKRRDISAIKYKLVKIGSNSIQKILKGKVW